MAPAHGPPDRRGDHELREQEVLPVDVLVVLAFANLIEADDRRITSW